MDYDSICRSVMDIDPKIRFSMIVVDGKQKFGGYRYDTIGILNSDELESSIWHAYDRMYGRKIHEYKLGKTRYAFAEYENVKRATFPLDETTMLLVSMEPDSNHDRIIKKILKIIKIS